MVGESWAGDERWYKEELARERSFEGGKEAFKKAGKGVREGVRRTKDGREEGEGV